MIGDRVGAIVSADSKTVKFLGYGKLIEDEVPIGAGGLGGLLVEMGIKNPTVLLDSGEKVFGCECWWGLEDRIRELIEGKEVIIVTPEAMRAGT